jgi:SAM-dependent methyltransferase
MGIKKRKYDSYKEYLKHQAKKFKLYSRMGKTNKFTSVGGFEGRIGKFKKYIVGDKILCLGARTGAEVEAFRNFGFFNAIGIDVNPGKNNKYVIRGDFNNMRFEDNSFDTIYCNCIDHAWELKDLSKEIRRVLVPSGRLILEIDHIVNKTKKERFKMVKRNGTYESIIWGSIEDVKKELKDFKTVFTFDSMHKSYLGIVLDVIL